MDVLFLIGRIVFALIFIFSGSTIHLPQAKQGIAYARMSGVPAPALLVPVSGLVAVAGGLSVALGVWADLGALAIVAFLLPVAFFMHAFWKETDEQTKANQMAHFMKNMALAGGALVIFYAYNQLQGDAGLSITDRSSGADEPHGRTQHGSRACCANALAGCVRVSRWLFDQTQPSLVRPTETQLVLT